MTRQASSILAPADKKAKTIELKAQLKVLKDELSTNTRAAKAYATEAAKTDKRLVREITAVQNGLLKLRA